MLIRFLPLFLLFFISSCSQTSLCFCGCNGSKHLSILSEVIDKDRLASVHVNAPDILQEKNSQGMRLYIHWKLPKKYLGENIQGLLKIRFKSPHQEEIPFRVDQLKGHFIYDVVDKEYFDHEGVLAYKIELFCDQIPIDQYQHKMWCELIEFEDDGNALN